MQLTFSKVLDSSLSQLIELRGKSSQSSSASDSFYYLRISESYLKGDTLELQNLVNQRDPDDRIAQIAMIRLHIRRKIFPSFFYDDIEKKFENAPLPIRAEFLFTLATSFYSQKKFNRSENLYLAAANLFEKLGLSKKQLKSLHNAISCKSSQQEELSLFADWYFLYEKAKTCKDSMVCATSLHNISREYQRLNALDISLKYANEALDFAKEDLGGLQYYLILSHRCHVLFNLGRAIEAERDFQSCKNSPFDEIKCALKLIEEKWINKITLGPSDLSPNLVPTWAERLSDQKPEKFKSSKLGGLQERLIEFLNSNGPKTKIEVMYHLYGDNIPYESVEGRFKNLLVQIRRKFPGLIVSNQGKYSISEPLRETKGVDL